MKVRLVIPAVAAALLLAGCADTGTKQAVGGVGGAVAGGLLGSQIGGGTGRLIATGVGTLAGAWLGSEIGRSLDRADQQHLSSASQRAHTTQVGETINWSNPDTGNRGTITPVRDGYTDSGRYCREYQQTITVDGRTETAYGTACRQSDGSWQLVDG